MAIKKKKVVLTVLGYITYFWLVFILSLYFTFPYQKLKKLIEYNLSDALGMQVKMESFSPSFFTGVKAEGIRIIPYASSEDQVIYPYIIDSLTLRISLLKLIIGDIRVSLFSQFLDGEIDGFVDIDDDTKLGLVMKELNLRRFAPLRSFIPLPVKGYVEGKGELKLINKDIKKAEGKLSITGKNIKIGDGKTPIPIPGQKEGLKLPPIEIKKFSLLIDIKRGIANIKKMKTNSNDIDLIGEGKIILSDKPSNIRFDTYFRFKFKKGFEKKGDIALGLVSALDFIPTMKRAKRKDGYYGFKITGTLSRGVNFTPSKKYRPSRIRRERRFKRHPQIRPPERKFKRYGPELNIK